MSKRDYKVATTDGIELEPLGDKENLTNGCKNGERTTHYILIASNGISSHIFAFAHIFTGTHKYKRERARARANTTTGGSCTLVHVICVVNHI